MKTRKTSLYTITLMVLAISLLSCNKWLDVKPKNQVKDTELYETENGFNEALSGVYATLTTESLYGKQLSYGLLGVLASEWDNIPTEYSDDKLYIYTTAAATIQRMDSIWVGMYFAITNANKILSEIDSRQSVFSGDNYRLIKGEALALRGFLHFELLRMFGASFAENPAKMAIPYYVSSSNKIYPQLTVTAVADSVLSDLKAAEQLLKDIDPIISGRVVLDEEGSFLQNRKVHLNYYAVKGLQSRLYLYKRDYPNALLTANEVIDSGRFPWVKQNNILSDTADVSGASEQVFGLNMVNMNQLNLKYFSDERLTGPAFTLSQARFTNDLFSGMTGDYRYLYLFKAGTQANSVGTFISQKTRQTTVAYWPEAYKNKLSVLKLSELYMIAAECLAQSNIGAAADKLNAVRQARGSGPLTITSANFREAMTAEYRREFIGEGQLFYYYKWLNMTIIPQGSENLVQLKAYKFPMPQAEYANANRVDNR